MTPEAIGDLRIAMALAEDLSERIVNLLREERDTRNLRIARACANDLCEALRDEKREAERHD